MFYGKTLFSFMWIAALGLWLTPVSAESNKIELGPADVEYVINAKKLFDFDVVDNNGKKLGDIEDLVLNQDNKVAYALVSVGGLLGIGDKLVAVPYDSLVINKADEKILLDVTKEQLERAPAFKLRDQ